jgi:transglutaminase-like putative cysteine protease
MTGTNHIPTRMLCSALAIVVLWGMAAGLTGLPAYALDRPPVTVEKRPVAEWVQIFPSPGIPDNLPHDEIQEGRYFLQVERQVKVSDTAPIESYRRFCIYMANETGLETSSQINISFDPSYETLEFNALRIIRQGSVIAKLADADIQLLRREEQLESMLYDGRYSAHIIVDDVRVGDILEYAYTIKGENPIYQDIFSDWLSVSWRIPVKRLAFILHWPKSRPFYQVSYKTDFVLERRETDEEIIYSLSGSDLKGYRGNSQTPTWYRAYGAIQMSQLNAWAEVVDWALPLYQVAYQDQAAVAQLARNLSGGMDTDEQRVMAVLSYLQKEIRYLGIEMGINSHRPSPPEETLVRRFGDCKDKTVAMVACSRRWVSRPGRCSSTPTASVTKTISIPPSTPSTMSSCGWTCPARPIGWTPPGDSRAGTSSASFNRITVTAWLSPPVNRD